MQNLDDMRRDYQRQIAQLEKERDGLREALRVAKMGFEQIYNAHKNSPPPRSLDIEILSDQGSWAVQEALDHANT